MVDLRSFDLTKLGRLDLIFFFWSYFEQRLLDIRIVEMGHPAVYIPSAYMFRVAHNTPTLSARVNSPV
jgi:hypothetical protein